VTNEALRDTPGWNGGAPLDGGSVSASEIDPSSELATLLAKSHGGPYHFVVFGLDNRAGRRDVVLDVGTARALHEGGAITTTTAPSPVIRVPAGDGTDGAIAVFPAEESFRDVRWIEIRVDGAPRRLVGRFFTRAEKRAFDGR
jgi:hypothetical protein